MGYTSGKDTADDLLSIDINWLNQQGYLVGWRVGTLTWTYGWDQHKSSIGIVLDVLEDQPYAKFNYTQTDRDTGEKKEFDYKVRLTSTPCNFGGKRWWFECPLVKSGIPCNKRVGKLYKNGDYFGCRHCYDLSYDSKNTNRQSKWSSTFRFLEIEQKAEKLEQQIKRRYYAGKPTRKQRQLYKLYEMSSGEYNKIDFGKLR